MRLYHIFYWSVRIAASIYLDIRSEGLENFPRKGPLIVIANHISAADPPVLGCVLPRPVHFMAKVELFRSPVLRWILIKAQAFPVQRGKADRGALREALRLLARDEVVVIFPEGHRSDTGELQEGRAGVVFLAQKTGVAVLPVHIRGHYGLRKPIALRFGSIFYVPRNIPRRDAQQFVMEKIRELG